MAEKTKNYEIFGFQSLLRGDIGNSKEVPMKVLCLGFPRTGTISLKKALERLGYKKCYHMSEWVIHPQHTDFWSRAVAAKFENGPPVPKEEWDAVLSEYQAGADLPFTGFAPELLEHYPNAKVILTNKSPEALWKSIHKAITFIQNKPWYFLTLNFLFDPFGRSNESRRRAVMLRFMKYRFFEGRDLSEEIVKRAFQEHYDEVRRLVPKERLLEYRIEEGWEPLCKFLGEDVPDVEFPRGNGNDDFQKAVGAIWKLQTTQNLVQGLLFAGGVWGMWQFAVRGSFSLTWPKEFAWGF